MWKEEARFYCFPFPLLQFLLKAFSYPVFDMSEQPEPGGCDSWLTLAYSGYISVLAVSVFPVCGDVKNVTSEVLM